jgi:hypothetical protein
MTSINLDIPTLAAAAAKAREEDPGWDQDAVTGAILAAVAAGWPASRVWTHIAREVADPDGHPRNLSRAARGPLCRAGSAPRAVMDAALAEMRSTLARAGMPEPAGEPGR